MAVFDIDKYRQMFLEEAEEIFEDIDSILLEAEHDLDMDEESINSLFRAVHTLKGNSASVELPMFAGLAHELEFFMDKLRNDELRFEGDMAELLIDSIDTIKEILELELSDAIEDEFYEKTKKVFLDRINGYYQRVQEKEEEEEEESYGLLLPKDENEAFGPIEGENKLVAFVEDDEFGFFEEETQESENKSLIKSDDFGFFDEEVLVTKSKVINDDDNFGFFDEKINSKTVVKQPGKKKTKKEKSDISKKATSKSSSNSIRVDLSKIDGLMNNIGELVIAHSMLTQYTFTMQDQKIKSDISERLDLIDRYIRELQESVMSVRMIPMETVFLKFPKVVRDTAKKLDKKIKFEYFGGSVEIDKGMIEGLTDPLMHIVRNAIDHGIEVPEKRLTCGKCEEGTLLMGAEQANGQMIIKIQDDGAGINIERVTAKAIENQIIDEAQAAQMSKEEKAMLIFAPGLSTAEAVTDISGRGVGMDVVMSNIKKLGGAITVDTEEGYGSTFTIALPLTLAILDGLNIRIGEKQFILPLSVIIESLQPKEDMIKQIGDGTSEVLMLREEFIPVARLHKIFHIEPQNQNLSEGMLIVVRSGAKKVALFVDEFMNQQQFVIKPLDKNFRTAHGIGGATVRGDGTIGLIIDTMNIMETKY